MRTQIAEKLATIHPRRHARLTMATMTIAVINQKGGVGKSMLAQNLAAVAHVRGFRTLLLDLDEQATSYEWRCARAETSRLRGLAVQRADNPKLWTLPNFAEMTEGFDVVVCDGPPRLAHVSQGAAVCADVALVPMRPGHAEFWAASANEKMLDLADAVRAQLGRPPVHRRYVLNEVFARTREATDMAEALHDKVALLTPIGHRVAFDRARGVGEAVITSDPEGAATREVNAAFDAVMSIFATEGAA